MHLLPLTYAYNFQVDRSMKVPLLSLRLTRTSPGWVTVVPKLASLVSNSDMASLMYEKLEVIKRPTKLWQKADKKPELLQISYNKDYSGSVRFSHRCHPGLYGFLHRPLSSHSTAKYSASERYNTLLICRQGLNRVIAVNKTISGIVQGDLEDKFTVHRSASNSSSRFHFAYEAAGK